MSDARRRAFFDRYGEETLKEGFFQDGNIQGGYCFNGDPFKIFEAFFGSNDAFCQMYGGENTDLGSMTGSALGGLAEKAKEPLCHQVVQVPCTLNELFNGATKQVDYTRQTLNPDGRTTCITPENRGIQIQKGSSPGDQVLFHGLGHESAGQQSSDLIFVIQQADHQDYRREGDDLVYTKDITLLQALTAQSTCLVTLDGREILVSLDEVVSPLTCKVVKGEGMPVKNSSCRGDLKLHFNIQFPKQVKPEDKATLKALLE